MDFENKKLEEFNEYIKYRKLAIIGLGVSNIPLLDYFYQKKARVTVFDERKKEEIPDELLSGDKKHESVIKGQFGKTIYEKKKDE